MPLKNWSSHTDGARWWHAAPSSRVDGSHHPSNDTSVSNLSTVRLAQRQKWQQGHLPGGAKTNPNPFLENRAAPSGPGGHLSRASDGDVPPSPATHLGSCTGRSRGTGTTPPASPRRRFPLCGCSWWRTSLSPAEGEAWVRACTQSRNPPGGLRATPPPAQPVGTLPGFYPLFPQKKIGSTAA